jgi:hypothetical protein
VVRKSLCFVLLLLGACEREEQVPAPTQEEAERLNEAEAELNALGNED